LRTYPNSPLPLLTNLEYFRHSCGEWNESLSPYQLKTRVKYDDPETNSSKSSIDLYVILSETINSKGNSYLRRQYKRLEQYRNKGEFSLYWQESWRLLRKSWSYKIAILNSWKPTWYKELSSKELNRIWQTLNSILNLNQRITTIRNVWIESPKNKWRQLGITNKGWRLYFHSINSFLSYLYEPYLSKDHYHGFIYNRGCKSWWEQLLWSPILQIYDWIYELDFSSGFPNLHLHFVRKVLKSDGLIPENLINLFLTHMNSPLQESHLFPTFESYVENKYNRTWRHSERSVHMGIGLSPLLYVISLNWVLKQIFPTSRTHQTHRSYADDLSFYFTTKGLTEFIIKIWPFNLTNYKPLLLKLLSGHQFITLSLNNLELFREAGLKVCQQKSGFVRIKGLWLTYYKSLGLKLTFPPAYLQLINWILDRPTLPELEACTRGRGPNPIKRSLARAPSNLKLKIPSTDSSQADLDLNEMLTNYRPYFGLIQSKLYLGEYNSSTSTKKSLRATLKPGSILYEFSRSTKYFKSLSINLHNGGERMSSLIYALIKEDPESYKYIVRYPSLTKRLKPRWRPKPLDILKEEIKNPLNATKSYNPLNWESDYFTKYSELNLTPEMIHELRKEYNLYVHFKM